MRGWPTPEDRKKAVARLWAEGHSTAAIARELRVTKNVVVGLAHRMADRPEAARAEWRFVIEA